MFSSASKPSSQLCGYFDSTTTVTFREYDSVERTVELDVDAHVRFLALHLQVLDLDGIRHGLQRPSLVVLRALQRAARRQRQSQVVAAAAAAGSVLEGQCGRVVGLRSGVAVAAGALQNVRWTCRHEPRTNEYSRAEKNELVVFFFFRVGTRKY